jgi:opacity protein-like surface antigen
MIRVMIRVASVAALMLSAAAAVADMPAKEHFKEQIPVAEPQQVSKLETVKESCGWGARLSGGAPVWVFQDQDTEVGGGLYLDVFPCETPINFRIGGEITHMDLTEDSAQAYAEFPGKTPRITYVRIPISVEYMLPVAEETTLYLGGGPDLIRTANDVSDFTVGGHLGGRLMYEFENNLSLSVDGGYMWATVDDGRGDVNLDGAYIVPTIGYRF